MARHLNQIAWPERSLTRQAATVLAQFASKMIFGGQYSIH